MVSFDVTQCNTTTEKSTSALQHMRQTHAGSPLRTMRTVRFTTADVRVARAPKKERTAIVLSGESGEFLYV